MPANRALPARHAHRCLFAESALAHYVNRGKLLAEGNSIKEGIGSSRITANLEVAAIDTAYSIPDDESVAPLHALIREEELCLGVPVASMPQALSGSHANSGRGM